MIDLLVVCCFGGLQATHLTLYSFDQRLHTFYLGLAKRLIDTDRISLFSSLYPDSGATYILPWTSLKIIVRTDNISLSALHLQA